MTTYFETGGGCIAYDVIGDGPLVVLAPGLGDVRAAYRFLAPELAAAGHRVVTTDLRGHGASSTGWDSYSRTDVADDLLALVAHLDAGPAVLVGASFAGGAVAIAAARDPERVRAVVQLGPGTRRPKAAPKDLTPRYLGGMALIAGAMLTRSVSLWGAYQRHAYPGARPDDFEAYLRALQAGLRGPGRMAAAAAMAWSSPADAEDRLGGVRCPALVVMGTRDPDFPDPRREAEGIVAAMPPGVGTIAMIDGAGHYPHAQFPGQVAEVVLPFLKEHAGA
ncbi:alpha/beta hydrolase [Streptomyces sp. NPDC003077]|uniref:alpha/beta fold hydrolase n=1 Tax=Streptomyces sp. NPDC003077 TaxID=3154443 RepID=UPI0033B10625